MSEQWHEETSANLSGGSPRPSESPSALRSAVAIDPRAESGQAPDPLENGRYRFVQLLGGGGFGNVWLGLDMKWSPGREVAIKRLRSDLVRHPDWRAMHSDALAGRLSSPHIAQIYDIVADGDGLAIVMEYVPGLTLKQWIAQNGPLSVEETLRVGRALVHALDEAHGKRVIHRDVKPANVMVAAAPGGGVSGRRIDEKSIKVVDWGLALGVLQWGREEGSAPMVDRSGYGSGDVATQWTPADAQFRFAGTAEYMAPEQYEGRVDRQADIWAFGCLLFECLTGERAFRGRGPELLKRIASAEVEWGELPAETPDRLRSLIDLCLQVEPRRRLREIGSALVFLDDGTPSRPDRTTSWETRDLLPLQPATFVPRADLTASLLAQMEESPLVAISGPLGSGKSWVAVRAARAALDRTDTFGLASGAALVDLVGVTDVKGLGAKLAPLAGEFDGRAESAGDVESLRQRFAPIAARGLLLVLDNADGAMRVLPDFLKGIMAPGLRILVTARRSAVHPGWSVFRVPPLECPPDVALNEGVLSVRALEAYESVQLFAVRAKAARRAFELDAANAPSVAGICRQLGGLPRAIELVASRVGFLTPEEILARLPQIVQPLVESGTGPNAETVVRTVQWAIDSTTDGERLLLERLAVFEGSWTLASVEHVCCDEQLPAGHLHDLLNGLVDLGLVQEETGVVRPRFRVLEFVRDQCRRRLQAPARASELGELRVRHLRRFAELATESPPVDAWGTRVPRAAERLDVDHELADCRAAIVWGLATPSQLEHAVDLAIDMQDHWYLRARYREGIDLLSSLLAAWGDRGDVRQVRLVAAWAKLHWVHDATTSHEGYQRALELQRRRCQAAAPEELAVERLRLARILQNVGLTAQQAGASDALESSRASLDEALAIYAALGNDLGQARTQFTLGLLDFIEGNFDRTREHLDRALPTVRAAGDAVTLGAIYQYKGRVALALRDAGGAIRWCRQALAMRRNSYEPEGIADSIRLAGDIAATRGISVLAVRLYAAAHRRRDAIGADLPPREVESYERMLNSVRSDLSPQAFDAAWADGMQISDDDVTALVQSPELS